jgi:hypothetical protein
MKYLKKFSESFDTMGSWTLIILVISTKKKLLQKKTKLILSIKVKCTNTEKHQSN